MRILLRNNRKGLFYAGRDRWTEDHLKASNFEDTNRAIDEAWDARLRDVEVVMRFEDPVFEIPLSIASCGEDEVLAEK